LEKVFEQTKL